MSLEPRVNLYTLALLLGCSGVEPAPTTQEPVDADGDGFAEAEDCDDADASVNPGAEEVCDGIDNNCDGIVDEDAIDRADWYADADGDGFGTGEVVGTACEPPNPFMVTQDGDCDDQRPDVHPGAAETSVCDRVDQDCDGSPEGPVTSEGAAWNTLASAITAAAPGAHLHVCSGTHRVARDIADLTLTGDGADRTTIVHTAGSLGGRMQFARLTLWGERRPALVGEPTDLVLDEVRITAAGGLFNVWPETVTARGVTLDSSTERIVGELRASGRADLSDLTIQGPGLVTFGGTVAIEGARVEGASLLLLYGAEVIANDVELVSHGDKSARLTIHSARGGSVSVGDLVSRGKGETPVEIRAGSVELDGLEAIEDAKLSITIDATTELEVRGARADEAPILLDSDCDGPIAVRDSHFTELVTHTTSGDVTLDTVRTGRLWAIARQDLYASDLEVHNGSLAASGVVDGRDIRSTEYLYAGGGGDVTLARVDADGSMGTESNGNVKLRDITVDRGALSTGGYLGSLSVGGFDAQSVDIVSTGVGVAAMRIASYGGSSRLSAVSVQSDGPGALEFSPRGKIDVVFRDLIAAAPNGVPLRLETTPDAWLGTFDAYGGRLSGLLPIQMEGIEQITFHGVGTVIGTPDCDLLSEAGCFALGNPANATCTATGCD